MNESSGASDGKRAPWADRWLSPLSPDRPRPAPARTQDRKSKQRATDTSLLDPRFCTSPLANALEVISSKVQPLHDELDDVDSVAATCSLPGTVRSQSEGTNVHTEQKQQSYSGPKRSTSLDDIPDVEMRLHRSVQTCTFTQCTNRQLKRSTSLDDIDSVNSFGSLPKRNMSSTDTGTSQYVNLSSDDDVDISIADISDDVTIVTSGNVKKKPGHSLDDYDIAKRVDRKAELLVDLAELDVQIALTTQKLEDQKRRRKLVQGELMSLRLISPPPAFVMDEDNTMPNEIDLPRRRWADLSSETKRPDNTDARRKAQEKHDKKETINWRTNEMTPEEFSLLHLWDNIEFESTSIDEQPSLPEKKQMNPPSA